jgi:DnaJ like chaperone protein
MKKNTFEFLRDLFAIHSWWGKMLGGFFGYLIAGPAGSIFGLLIGNLFDRGLSTILNRPHWYYHAEKQKEVQRIFFYTTFATMGHLAKADGRVSEQEIHMARVLMDEMRLSKAQQKLAQQYFSEGKQSDFKLSQAIAHLVTICHQNRNLLKLFADIQYRAAKVDGLSQNKIKSLDVIFKYLGFAPLHRQHRFYQDYEYSYTTSDQSSTDDSLNTKQKSHVHWAYAILEITPKANKNEIKRAYRKLMSQNHPDKLIAQGLPEEMIKLATDKTQKIQKAYEQIKKEKGF